VLWQLTHAMLRWMAPFLSFTAEEAWAIFAPRDDAAAATPSKPSSPSIFTETWWKFETPDEALLAKWARVRAVRDVANKEIEALRAAGQVGSSLQANLTISAAGDDHALLATLGDDLRFVTITSQALLAEGPALAVTVTPSGATKCERCWHWRDDVGHDPAHPSICGRCTSNLYGTGEPRRAA
jgi:isoleucyl-tRNA synthetase